MTRESLNRKFDSFWNKSVRYIWTCYGCLIKEGVKPDSVTESCVARFNNCTCHFCGHIQDQSWFKHANFLSLPESLQKRVNNPND